LRIPEEAALTPEGLRQHRETYVAAMRAYNAGEIERRMRSWTLPFLIRHSAFHTLDHAWEMEDKDLSAQDAAGPPVFGPPLRSPLGGMQPSGRQSQVRSSSR
jgi:hypothetical protein